jgi:hypothetical protein
VRQRGLGARVEKRLPAHRSSAGSDQVAVGRRLQHVSGRARAQGLEEVLLVVVHGEHQDLEVRPLLDDLTRCLEPGHARHGDIEHRQVDVVVERDRQGPAAVTRLGHDLEVRLGVDYVPEAAPDHRVVVGQQDTGLQGNGHVAGTSSSTSTPPSGAGERRS